MEKFINILKGLAIFIVIAFIGFGIYDLAIKTGGFFDSIISIFNSEPIIIDPHKNATSNLIPFTKEEIDAETSNPECPDLGDITDKIYIQEYNDVVVFYKETKDQEGKTFYPNLLFLKTKEGLVYNGCTNLHASVWIWFGSETIDSFVWEPHFYEKPFVQENCMPDDKNFVVYSSGTADTFICFQGMFKFPNHELYLNKTRDYINENIYPYFLSFYNDNVKIYQESKETAGVDFNAFYDYLFRSYKTGELSGTVEMTKYTFCQIPEEEQSKYPMNESENFKFYKYNFFLKYEVEKINRSLLSTNWQDDIDANVEVIDTKKIEDEPITIPTVVLRLKDSGYDVDLSSGTLNAMREFFKHYKSHGEILEEHPVVFEFSQNGEKLKNYKFASYNDILNGVPLNLKPGDYDYTITSDAFIFESTYGKLEVSKSSAVQFEYSYLEDSAIVNISLKPISSGDAEIIVSNKPVLFTFINKDTKENFSLIFKNTVPGTDKIILPFGSYDYIISSELVNFSPKNGEITVSATNHSFIFEYFVSSSSGFLLNADFGTAEALTVKIPTFETENGALNHRDLTEVWIYHIDSTGKATIKKVSSISNITETEAVILVPYTELSDNFGTTNSTYQLRLFYGQTSYFTTAVQGDTPVKEFSITYDTVMGI